MLGRGDGVGSVIIRGVRLRDDQRKPWSLWSSLIVSFYVIGTPPSTGNHRRTVLSSFYKGDDHHCREDKFQTLL